MKRPVLITQNGIDTLNAYLEETRAYMNKLEADNAALVEENQALRNELEALRDEIPPIENGKNRYGLDVSYFRNLFNRELNRSLRDFRPDELARVLARASRTADESVMFEKEFIDINKIKADAVNDLVSSESTNVSIEGTEWAVIYVEDAHTYASKLEQDNE